MLIYYDENGKRMKGNYEGHRDQKYGHTTFSQHGEDLLILNLFDQLKIEKPSYLDLGAHHPINISNTKLLYDRGSRGVNIEANPYLISLFFQQRPDDINVSIGVTHLPCETEAEFLMYDHFSGRNTFLESEVEYAKDSVYGKKITQKIAVNCKSINKIVEEYCGSKFPDFLSCDLEGLDYDVLNSANFEDYGKPKILCVEARDINKMQEMIEPKGFQFICCMGNNMIFVSKNCIEYIG
jgi:hypothetical protein